MARPIDADALAKEFDEKCGNECECCEYAVAKIVLVGHRKCRIFERCGLIANAPTIPAIPVEWLRKWPKSLREGAYVRDILKDWQKEQEGKNEADKEED